MVRFVQIDTKQIQIVDNVHVIFPFFNMEEENCYRVIL